MTSNDVFTAGMVLAFLVMGMVNLQYAMNRKNDKPVVYFVIALCWFWFAIVTIISRRGS